MLSDCMVAATVAASDFARARRFYEDRLGLSPSQDMGDAGVIYTCGGGTAFLLYPSQFAGTNQATTMTWQTANLDAEMAQLRARGVVFEEYDFPGLKTVNGVAEFPGGRGAWFKDSEGNILALAEM